MLIEIQQNMVSWSEFDGFQNAFKLPMFNLNVLTEAEAHCIHRGRHVSFRKGCKRTSSKSSRNPEPDWANQMIQEGLLQHAEIISTNPPAAAPEAPG